MSERAGMRPIATGLVAAIVVAGGVFWTTDRSRPADLAECLADGLHGSASLDGCRIVATTVDVEDRCGGIPQPRTSTETVDLSEVDGIDVIGGGAMAGRLICRLKDEVTEVRTAAMWLRGSVDVAAILLDGLRPTAPDPAIVFLDAGQIGTRQTVTVCGSETLNIFMGAYASLQLADGENERRVRDLRRALARTSRACAKGER